MNATSSRGCNEGTGNWVCTLNVYDQLTVLDKAQPIYFWANDSSGNYHSVYNLTIGVTLVTNFTRLDGVNENRTYEFETTARVTSTLSYIDILDDTGRYRNESSPLDYLLNILRINEFSNTSTEITIASGSSETIAIDNRTDLYNASLNLTGSSSRNITLNVSGEIINFPGTLIENNLFQDKLIYSGTLYQNYNLSFSTAGSKTIYLNFSNQGNLNREGYLNLTITAFDLDKGNDFDYQENFSNSTFVGNLTNVSSPMGIVDDFNVNNSEWYLLEESCSWGRYPSYPCTSGYTSSTDCDKPIGSYIMQYGQENNDNYLQLQASATAPNYCGSASRTNRYAHTMITLDNASKVILRHKLCLSASKVDGSPGTGTFTLEMGDDNENYVTMYSRTITISGSGDGSNSATYYDNVTLNRITDDSWEVFLNGISQGIKNTGSLGTNEILVFKTHGSGNSDFYSGATGTASTYIFELNQSGIWLDRDVNGTYVDDWEGEFKSLNITTTTNNIARVYLTVSEYKPENTKIDYYASNNNGTTWESVTPNTFHTFTTSDNDLKVKFVLNTTDNLTSPVINKYRVQIIPSSPSSAKVDIGSDGIIDWDINYTLNSTTTPVNYSGNDSGINNYINENCLSNSYCSIPITVIAGSGGILEISNFNLTENINPVRLNVTPLQDLSEITLSPTYTGGTVLFDDLAFDFRGSKNITVYAHNDDYTISLNRTIFVKYSPFNLSFINTVDYFDVIYSSRNQSNVEPEGQNSSHGIFQITSLAYDGNTSIFAKYNASPHVCLTKQEFRGQNFSVSFNNSLSTLNITNLTTSYLPIVSDLNSSSVGNVRAYSMINCSAYSFAFIPFEYFCFTSKCSECVTTLDFEDTCEEMI